MNEIAELIDGLPNICGNEEVVRQRLAAVSQARLYQPISDVEFGKIRAACAVALHMHQPLIPAGGDDLSSAAIISNLQYMMEHPTIGDNHNAPVFHTCYRRMGEIIPELVEQGHFLGLHLCGLGEKVPQALVLVGHPLTTSPNS